MIVMKTKDWMLGFAYVIFIFSLFGNVGHSLSWDDTQSLFPTNETTSNSNLIDFGTHLLIGNLARFGSTANVQTGHILGARGPYSSVNYFMQSELSLWDSTESFTITAWVKPTSDNPGGRQIFADTDPGGGGKLALYLHWANDLGGFRFAIAPSGSGYACDLTKTTNVKQNVWYFVAGTYNGSSGECSLYVNDTKTNASVSLTATRTTLFFVGGGNGYWEATDFYIEQISVWNSSLDEEGIAWIYNSGLGQNYTFPDTLAIAYLSPDFLNISDSNDVNFSIVPTSSLPIQNCSLFMNGSMIFNQTNPANATTLTTSQTLANGTYNFTWNCYADPLYQNTTTYILNVMVPVIPLTPGQCSIDTDKVDYAVNEPVIVYLNTTIDSTGYLATASGSVVNLLNATPGFHVFSKKIGNADAYYYFLNCTNSTANLGTDYAFFRVNAGFNWFPILTIGLMVLVFFLIMLGRALI